MFKLFISDLHLEEDRPDMAEIFLRFLAQDAKHAEALYILGDFFDVWIGDDNLTPFNQLIIQALQRATLAGLSIYLMHGNRDFLLGKNFLRETGCQLLPDEYKLDIYGTPTLLMHGDTLCTEDKAYLKFRKKSRNYFLQKLFLWKSLKKRRLIAENYRLKSKMHTSTVAGYIMDVTQQAVARKMQQYQVQHLIHGHTHRKAIHEFKLGNQSCQRIVLGPWHENGNALIWDESGEKKFIALT